jgi:hypothetical protein
MRVTEKFLLEVRERTKCVFVLFAIFVFGFLSGMGPMIDAQDNKATIQRLAEAENSVNDFKKTLLVKDLRDAVSLLSATEATTKNTAEREQQRQRIARLWIAIFYQIENHSDPKFNFEDVPLVNVVPPPAANGVTYPSGVDSKDIPDLTARAQYQKELDSNNLKAKQYEFQDRLRNVEEKAEFGFQRFAKRSYTASTRKELEHLMEQGDLTSAQRNTLLQNAFSK